MTKLHMGKDCSTNQIKITSNTTVYLRITSFIKMSTKMHLTLLLSYMDLSKVENHPSQKGCLQLSLHPPMSI